MNARCEQKYLKVKGTILLIAFMNMIMPLSLDMYLPAVPQMAKIFSTNESTVNLTLVGFFFFMAVGILLCCCLLYRRKRKKTTGDGV